MISASTFFHTPKFNLDNQVLIHKSTISVNASNSHMPKIPICPKCNKNTFITILSIHCIEIKCSCGYTEKLSLKDYQNAISGYVQIDCPIHKNISFMYYCPKCGVNLCQLCLSKHKSHEKIVYIKEFTINEEDKIRTKIANAYNSINKLTLFSDIKTNCINRLLKQINELETSYEEFISNNNKILKIIEDLINSYNRCKPNYYIVSNLLKNANFTISTFPDNLEKNYENILHFFKTFSIIKMNKTKRALNIKLKKELTTNQNIHSILKIDNNTIALCGNDNNIIYIINLKTEQYHAKLIGHNDTIWSMTLLSPNKIASCSSDKSIIIWLNYKLDYKIENAHNEMILNVITLTENRFASSSQDATIKIWKSTAPYELLSTLIGHRESIPSLLMLNNKSNNLLSCSGEKEKQLRLWDLTTFNCLGSIDNIHCSYIHSMIQLEDSQVIIGGANVINIVNTITFKLEATFESETFGILLSIFQIGNHLLMGSRDNMLYLFDLETKSKYIISSLLANKISTVISVIRLDDETLLSASYDGKLQFYKI